MNWTTIAKNKVRKIQVNKTAINKNRAKVILVHRQIYKKKSVRRIQVNKINHLNNEKKQIDLHLSFFISYLSIFLIN